MISPRECVPRLRQIQIGSISACEAYLSDSSPRKPLDEICDALPDLREVRINLVGMPSISPIHRIKTVVNSLPRIKANTNTGLSLTFIVNGKQYSWERGFGDDTGTGTTSDGHDHLSVQFDTKMQVEEEQRIRKVTLSRS